MLCRVVGALTCLVLSIALVQADEYKGTVKKVDAEKNTLTVSIDEKDRTFDIPKDAKIYTTGKKKKGKPAPEVPVALGDVKENAKVVVTTKKEDDKETVTSVQIEREKKKKKKKDAN
jgi:hypothetical protein